MRLKNVNSPPRVKTPPMVSPTFKELAAKCIRQKMIGSVIFTTTTSLVLMPDRSAALVVEASFLRTALSMRTLLTMMTTVLNKKTQTAIRQPQIIQTPTTVTTLD